MVNHEKPTPHTLPVADRDGCVHTRLDLDRAQRCGFAEVIFAQGKTPEQVAHIARELAEYAPTILATRATPAQFEAVKAILADSTHTTTYHEMARVIAVASGTVPAPDTPDAEAAQGLVVVASGGTADMPVAEEAALCAEAMGAQVERLYDVGIAGVHRVLEHTDLLQKAQVVIAVAGMEGALPSLVAGLVKVPVIAVPTSVGYGAHFDGLAPLLTMLNSCASGISVVNIDNGFGAAVVACRML
ncbi:MAG: nickel pincer cofactor biosynthesis protein LarB [Coriobacteriia bacterium]|nr:nickel pincer cofactor biosynthesis protein LarB [Coriobacteriia bacterium]